MIKVSECVDETNDSNIVVSERGRVAHFKNPDRKLFRKIQVDGCLIQSSEVKRADWIVTKIGIGSVIVELKGRDVERACLQALSSRECALCAPHLEKRVSILIVCSRFPAFDTTIARHQEQARKKGIHLKVICNKAEVIIEELLGAQRKRNP